MDIVIDFGRDFVKVPRTVIQALARYPLALAVYLVLLGRTRYAPGVAQLGQGLVDLEIGEAVAGRADLAVACSASENKIRTALEHLQRLRLVTVRATNRGSKVTICGYAESVAWVAGESPAVPPAESPATAPADHQQTTSQTTTNKILRSEIQDPDPARPDRAREMAQVAVAAINRLSGREYRADSDLTLRMCRALVRARIAPEQVAQAIEHVGRPWIGHPTFADKIRPQTLLQVSRVRGALDDLAAGQRTTPAQMRLVAPTADEFTFDESEAS